MFPQRLHQEQKQTHIYGFLKKKNPENSEYIPDMNCENTEGVVTLMFRTGWGQQPIPSQVSTRFLNVLLIKISPENEQYPDF